MKKRLEKWGLIAVAYFGIRIAVDAAQAYDIAGEEALAGITLLMLLILSYDVRFRDGD